MPDNIAPLNNEARDGLPRLLSTKDIELAFGFTAAQIAYWRHTGQGPRGAKFGKKIFYKEADVLTWINARFEAEAA